MVHKVGEKSGNMHVLLLFIVLEYRFKHIPRIGDFLGAFVANVTHAELNEPRFQLFIVAMFHIPKHDRGKTVFSFE